MLQDDHVVATGGRACRCAPARAHRPEEVGRCGTLLGALREAAEREDVVVPVAPGDTLCSTRTASRRRGTAALRRRGSRRGDAAPEGAEALLRAVAGELDAFERGTSLDDRAMLALRRRLAGG